MPLLATNAGTTEAALTSPLRISKMNEIGDRIRRPFLTGLAILLIAGFSSYFAFQRYRFTSLQVAYSHEVIAQLNDLLANIDRAESAERAFLTSGNRSVNDARLPALIHQNLERLRQATAGGMLPERDFDLLDAQVQARLDYFNRLSAIRTNQGEAAATAMFTAGQADNLSSAIHDRVQRMNGAQERRFATHLVSEHLFSHLLGFIVVAGCIMAFTSVAYAGYFVEGALKLITTHLSEDARVVRRFRP